MKRTATLAAAVALVVGLLSGCGGATSASPSTPTPTPTPAASATADTTVTRIASLQGPTTMGLVKLMDDAATGKASQAYEATMYGTADEVVPKLTQGDVDVALLPANLASVLYNKTQGTPGALQVAAVNTLGVLDVVETGDTVHSVADLAGRTVYSTGRGTTPQFVLEHLLRANGLDPAKDVTIEYKSEATELAAVLAGDPSAIGVLPQPYVTVLQSKNPAVRIALDLTDEWDAVSPDSQLVTGVLVVRAAFAAEHPEVFAQFLADYEASTRFTNESPAQAAELIAAAGIVPAAPLAEKAIPAAHITFLAGAELRTALGGYLQVLYDADPASVGGSVPGDGFYYQP